MCSILLLCLDLLARFGIVKFAKVVCCEYMSLKWPVVCQVGHKNLLTHLSLCYLVQNDDV